MNVVKIMGGLGNQLFQYAFGQAIKETGTKVAYDVLWYDPVREKTRPYCLDKFYTDVPVALLSRQNKVREKGFDPELLKENGTGFYGYWQSPMYYSDNLIAELDRAYHVRKEFYTSEFLKLKGEIESVNAVSVHIRRGDYLDNPNHFVLPLHYYDDAMDLILKTKGSPVFYIFSDDSEYCSKMFGDYKQVHLSEWLDFELMRCCKHHIIANSTFSWWPAFLSKEATVLCPDTWTYDILYWAERGIMLNRWIKLPV